MRVFPVSIASTGNSSMFTPCARKKLLFHEAGLVRVLIGALYTNISGGLSVWDRVRVPSDKKRLRYSEQNGQETLLKVSLG